ncbi:MAG: ureidoglycolate lyase [Gammaproteobacteria bacterium]|nr:ureidoglycolate lyase [Gammaproteobacteria bacterium]
MTLKLKAQPISAERFAPFGDVIHAGTENASAMNDARFLRFNDLARIEVDPQAGGRPCVSIARCRTPTSLPYCIEMMERHPKGSQAFVPLAPFSFLVVVAPPAESVDTAQLHAFVTSGREGVNYRKGVWHMPMIGLSSGQQFLIIDRAGDDSNCEEIVLGESVIVDIE